MPDPTRFAGYSSPEQLADDPALTREQKVSALMAWRAMLQQAPDPGRLKRLAAAIDRAIEALQATTQ